MLVCSKVSNVSRVVRFSKASKVRDVRKVNKASKDSEVCKVSKLSKVRKVRKVRKVSKISKVSIVSRIVNVHCAGATFTMEGECFPPWVGTMSELIAHLPLFMPLLYIYEKEVESANYLMLFKNQKLV